MDEGRKRVLLLAASIFEAARKTLQLQRETVTAIECVASDAVLASRSWRGSMLDSPILKWVPRARLARTTKLTCGEVFTNS
jgi:hypothetical protein